MHTNNPLPQPGRRRRTYSLEFKSQLVAACRIPGMSVASVARNHGINHNVLHRWLRELPEYAELCWPSVSNKSTPAFIELPITEPLPKPTESPACSPTAVNDSVRVEIQRTGLSVTLSWPASAAPPNAQWLLELLR